VRTWAAVATVLVALAAATSGCSGDRDSGPVTGRTIEADGSTVIVWGRGERGVVLAHGGSFDAASWEDEAVLLADRGVAVAAVEDLSADAVVDAAAYLREQQGATDVTLVGSSAGAVPVLESAAAEPDLAGGVVVVPPAGGDLAGLGRVPVLVIYGEDEALAGDIEALVAAAPDADLEVLAIPGDRHGQGILDGDQADEVRDAVVDWARRP